MSKHLWGLGIILCIGAISVPYGGLPTARSAPTQSQLQSVREEPKQTPEETAILEADAAFVKDYNSADTRALVARFSEDAEIVEQDGTRYRGRPTIEQRLKETFEETPGATLAIKAESIQLLTPEVAKEEGQTTITLKDGQKEKRRHTAYLVKRDGHWLISTLREEAEELVPPGERLKEIEWLVGDWIDEGHDSHVKIHCQWSPDKNFLLRDFTMLVEGKPVMTVSQRIGWDPLAHQFRSWEFDSEGGYGEGRWSRDGQGWMIKHRGVRPEGLAASATYLFSRERPDVLRWTAVDRVIGGETQPTEEAYTMVRVPPQPGGAASKPASAPTSHETRTP